MTKKILVDRALGLDPVLKILSWLAKEEREPIKKPQREGIDVKFKNGVKFGRPKAELTDEFITVYTEWKAGQITATEAMRRADMKRTTFYKLVKEYEEKQAN
ncbi:recombinase family protein [Bacillus sp. EB600]|uniref:recombinase family protein n=1 Tax=Bacillus sp. EB600 TaxID=2806345 RepID=UPI0028110A69|nr:recombinase family protein [Bacillus sp. EB600]MCQ6280095.1 recombinase family protein [Bacillus sp. EB600]